MAVYRGGCHCGAIKFEVDGDLESALECNCSICSKAGFLHWRIEPGQLRMLTPRDAMSTYIWGTGRARHYFCKVCGVSPLRNRATDPSKMTVNVRCLDGVDIDKLAITHFDGRSWTPPTQ